MTGPIPTPPDQILIDAAARHQVHLLRFASGMVRRILGLLRGVDDRLATQIAAKLARLSENERGEITGPVWTTDRLKALASDIKALTKLSSDNLSDALASELLAFVEYERDFQAGLLPKTFGVQLDLTMPSPQQLYSAVMARPLMGKHLRTIIRELDAQVRSEIMRALREGYLLGETTDQITRRLSNDVLGDWKRRHVEGLVRTATNHAATIAREKLYAENTDMFTGVRWVSTLDHRTTAVCRARDGKVYPVDSGPRPPAHFNCLPGDALVLPCGRVTGASKRWYDGDLIIVRTAAGHELPCTPNHPILTDRGWVSAQFIDRCHKVVRDSRRDRPSVLIYGEGDHVPARIEEVAEAFFRSLLVVAVPVPTTAEDFHGDGMEGEVAVVGAYGDLRLHCQTSGGQQADKLVFVRRVPPRNAEAFEGARGLCQLLRRDLAPAHGGIRTSHQPSPLVLAQPVHHGGLLAGAVPEFDPGLPDHVLDGTWTDAEDLRDASHAEPGLILLDDVLSVSRRQYRGHVFNLQTEKSYYSANGLITHNCRSTTVPVVKTWRELGIDMDETPEAERPTVVPKDLKAYGGKRKTKDEDVVLVPSSTTYNAWLRTQPRAFVDDLLGKSKAKLYMEGKLTLDRFVDHSGREYTLPELRKREADAFKRAGL